MKKLCVILGMVGALAVSAYAGVEIDLDYSAEFTNQFLIDYKGTGEQGYANEISPAGFDIKVNWYFVNQDIFEFGLTTGYSFNPVPYKNLYLPSTGGFMEITHDASRSFFFGLAMKWSFAEKASFHLNPKYCIQVINGLNSNQKTISASESLFDLDAGFKIWLTSSNKFNVGLNTGVNLAVGGSDYYYVHVNQKDAMSGVALRGRWYFGLTLKFGKNPYVTKQKLVALETIPQLDLPTAYVFDCRENNLDVRDHIVVDGLKIKEPNTFTVYGYRKERGTWVRFGNAMLNGAGDSFKIECGDIDEFRYFAVVPQVSAEYVYDIDEAKHDLYIYVSERANASDVKNASPVSENYKD